MQKQFGLPQLQGKNCRGSFYLKQTNKQTITQDKTAIGSWEHSHDSPLPHSTLPCPRYHLSLQRSYSSGRLWPLSRDNQEKSRGFLSSFVPTQLLTQNLGRDSWPDCSQWNLLLNAGICNNQRFKRHVILLLFLYVRASKYTGQLEKCEKKLPILNA